MKYAILGIAMVTSLMSIAQSKITPPVPVEDPGMDGYLKNRKPAAFKIKLVNSNGLAKKVSVKYTIVHLGPEMQVSNITQLGVDNEATIVLSENLPYQQVWLSVEGFLYVGIVVNSDLEIIIDADKVKSEVFLSGNGITFNGKDADLNKSLIKRALYRREDNNALQNIFTGKSIDAANNKISVDQYIKTTDSVHMELQKIDETFIEENPDYAWAIENEAYSFYYNWLLTGFSNKAIPGNLKSKIEDHKPYFLTNDGVGFYRSLSSYLVYKKERKAPPIQEILYSNKKNLTPAKKEVLDSIAYYEASPDANKEAHLKRLYAKRYEIFKNEINIIYCKDALSSLEMNNTGAKSDILKLGLMERWKDNFNSAYPVILTSMKTSWTKRFVQNKLQEALTKQQEIEHLFKDAKAINNNDVYIGKPLLSLSFGANLYVLDSLDKVDDFIVNLRSKFKDKVLIIDIWATWCAPCIGDIPYSKKLHEENADLPIEYIYLCTTSSSDIDIWKNRIGNLKAPGTHIFINDEFVAALRKKLDAEGGYPTYVVIDTKGKVNSKSISFMGGLNRESLMSLITSL